VACHGSNSEIGEPSHGLVLTGPKVEPGKNKNTNNRTKIPQNHTCEMDENARRDDVRNRFVCCVVLFVYLDGWKFETVDETNK
jgi:hypothetical protein